MTTIFIGAGVLGIIFVLFRIFGSGETEPLKESQTIDNIAPGAMPDKLEKIDDSMLPDSIPKIKESGVDGDGLGEAEEQIVKTDGKLIRMTVNEIEFETIKELSKQYHPFYKVSLHVAGHSSSTQYNLKYYISASSNGQELFNLTMKDLMLAGYTVQVFGECIIEIKYHKYRDFLVCDVPTVGAGQIASNN
jgi:hypothetical protein